MKKIYTIVCALIAIIGTTFAQNGTLDSTFNTGTGVENQIRTSLIQSDGKIIIGGDFTTFNGTARNRITRLNTDGTLDTTFNTGAGANGFVFFASIQNDEKIIICGDFTAYNGTARNRIARLNVDGTLDTTFNPGTGANSWIYSNSIQSDGKIIVCGEFTTFNGDSINYLARLNVDGTTDTTFNQNIGANNFVYTTSIQSDGKIIVGGMFTSYNDTSRNYIARLNADGTLDNSFDPGIGTDYWVHSSKIQNDGKILIAGGFTSYNGIVRVHIARLNSDGTLDLSFDPGTGPNGDIFSISFQPNQKIIIGGTFGIYNGYWKKFVARLNIDGSLDLPFNFGTGASGWIFTTSIQSDGKIIIGGDFFSFNGIIKYRIARLENDLTVGIDNLNSSDDQIKLFPNPTEGLFTLQVDEFNGALVSVYNSTGQLLIQQKISNANNHQFDLSKHAAGLYIVEVNQGNSVDRFKVSKQ